MSSVPGVYAPEFSPEWRKMSSVDINLKILIIVTTALSPPSVAKTASSVLSFFQLLSCGWQCAFAVSYLTGFSKLRK